MNLQTHSAAETVSQVSSRLEPMLVRLPRTLASQLRELARTTRVRQSDYLREAVADLLAKYSRNEIARGDRP